MREFYFDVETTRQAFGRAAYDYALLHDNCYAIGADTVKNLGFSPMQKRWPERVLNVGIAEQNMMGMAAGLAADGNTVFVGTYAPFATMRALEQFRTFIAYPHLNVKIGGGMSGFSAGNEGPTHQGPEDSNIMALMPGNVVVAPADAASAYVISRAVFESDGPAYIRLGKTPFYKVFDEHYTFDIGKGRVLESGDDLTIVCYGTMVSRSLQAAELLREKGIQPRVIEMPCIKPFDRELILSAAKETGALLVAEEAFKIGGLASAIALYLAENHPSPMVSIAIDDVFGEAGVHYDIMDKYRLSVMDIVQKAELLLRRSK